MTSDRETPQEEFGLVLLHGAGLGSWIWEDVSPHLDVPDLAVSFPGRDGERGGTAGLGLDDYASHVRRQIEAWSVERVVLVTHSIGGVVGIEAAGRLPDRVVGFVGVSAAIPEPGGSFLSCLPLHQRVFQRAILRLVGTKPPDRMIRSSLCKGLSADHADRVVEGFTPESRELYTDGTTATVPDCPTLYVETTEDPELSDSMQETMAANLHADEVVTVAAGHLPMLSHPGELADALNEFADRV